MGLMPDQENETNRELSQIRLPVGELGGVSVVS
jgi:hypothetical protein